MVGSHFNEAAANDALQRMAAGVPPMASAEYLTAAAVLQFDPGRCATGTGSGSPERRGGSWRRHRDVQSYRQDDQSKCGETDFAHGCGHGVLLSIWRAGFEFGLATRGTQGSCPLFCHEYFRNQRQLPAHRIGGPPATRGRTRSASRAGARDSNTRFLWVMRGSTQHRRSRKLRPTVSRMGIGAGRPVGPDAQDVLSETVRICTRRFTSCSGRDGSFSSRLPLPSALSLAASTP